MRILLTGSTGFLGSHLIRHFKAANHEVVPYTRESVLIPDLVDDEFGGHLDCIIHAAAELTDKVKMWESNVVFTHKLLQFAERVGVKRFIYIGSSSEYGNIEVPRREDMVCAPNDLYSATKLAGTALCQGFGAQYGLNVSIIRPFSLYGPGDKARKLIPRLIQSARTGDVIKVNPNGVHDWIYIDDFCDGVLKILDKDQWSGDIVNLGTGVESTNLDIVKALSELGHAPTVQLTPPVNSQSCPDVAHWVADVNKAWSRRYGWRVQTSLKEGLKKILDHVS